MSLCIQYSRPASGLNDNEIYGFDVAVTNFITAYFRYSTTQQFICRPTDMPSFEHFKALAALEGLDAEKQCIGLDPRHPEKNLQSITCLFRPDPLICDPIWRRQQLPGRGYSTCGLVHTMSGERIVRAVGDICTAPSDGTDALICPSVSIRDAVQSLWAIQCDYLNFRFGGKFACPVQTPVIPLGINTDRFAKLCTPEHRTQQRDALGVDDDDEIVILFVGRLSFATKAHPLPLFIAAEKAAQQTKHKVRLVMFGYFKPKDMEPHFRNLAADLCKTAKVEFITNDDSRFPNGLWAGADIFASLSDNVQESFGLTPIEAMACGLPAVISDWNGYREGVREGSEGFLIPTATPPPAAGMAIAQSYYNEGNYGVALSGASQSTSIDIDKCAEAFLALITNSEMRRSFGTSGKNRARDTFDWRHIIRAYDELWSDLAEKRSAVPPSEALPANWQALNPAYPNPWAMFSSFPSAHLSPEDVLRIVLSADDTEMILQHEMNYFVPALLLPKDQLIELISIIRRVGRAHIHNLLSPFPRDRHDVLWRCIGWMLKHGICALERHPS